MALNWNAIDFDWNQARSFLATAEAGSLSGAARLLGTTQPTVGRQVSALEEALGVVLFERAGRGLVLTPSGADVLSELRAMGEAAARVSLVASGRAEDVAGKVAISVSDLLAVHVMPPIIGEISERAPELEIELIATNEVSDLLRRDADIAVRHQAPKEPDLIARKLRSGVARFYASEAFVQTQGTPETMAEAKSLPFIGFGPQDGMDRELAQLGISLPPGSVRIYSASIFAAWEMVRAGLGIGIMSEQIAEASPDMRPVLRREPVLPVETWLVTHRELRSSRRIRLVWDILSDALG